MSDFTLSERLRTFVALDPLLDCFSLFVYAFSFKTFYTHSSSQKVSLRPQRGWTNFSGLVDPVDPIEPVDPS
jgi:hypothetical protein